MNAKFRHFKATVRNAAETITLKRENNWRKRKTRYKILDPKRGSERWERRSRGAQYMNTRILIYFQRI